MSELRNLVIAGGGPAGLTAALYAARGGVKPYVLEGLTPGGELSRIERLENYPGFPGGISGAELAAAMREQAEKAGASLEFGAVLRTLEPQKDGSLLLRTDDASPILTRALIIATGSAPKTLDIPGEERFLGRGVSYCATCDGSFFKEKPVTVVGSGPEAFAAAFYLTNLCSHVTLVVPGKKLSVPDAALQKLSAAEKISLLTQTAPVEILSENGRSVTALRVRNGERLSEISCNAVFIALGSGPASQFAQKELSCDADGRILTTDFATSLPGVFAAGDVQTPYTKQVVTACAEGCLAALAALRYLNRNQAKEDTHDK